MPKNIYPCVMKDREFSRHGCFYALNTGGPSESRTCGSPCCQKLIQENVELKSKVEQLQSKLAEVQSEM